MKRYSTFIDNIYIPLFPSFYNSYKYYGHKIPLHVYDFKGLNTFNLQYLKKYVDVTTIDFSTIKDFHKYQSYLAFKISNMVDNMVENEFLVDIDINFLNNVDYLFDEIEKGNLVIARECENHANMYLKHGILFDNLPTFDNNYVSNKVNQIKEYCKNIQGANNEKIDIGYNFYNLNTGFVGYSKEKHLDFLRNVDNILYDDEIFNNYLFRLDQFAFSFLMGLMDNISKVILPQKEWMNTWETHSNPLKMIKVEDGKYVLRNENGSRVNIYHYTGDIGVPNKNNEIITGRLFFLTNDYIKSVAGIYCSESKNMVDLWVQKHQNPILFLYKFFYDNGEAKCPKYYNHDFKKNISKLLLHWFNEEHDFESAIVFTIALLYDYVNELNYSLIGDNKYYKIVKYLLNKEVLNSQLTIGIECENAIVNFTFTNPNPNEQHHDFFYSLRNKDYNGIIVERLKEMYIITNYKLINEIKKGGN